MNTLALLLARRQRDWEKMSWRRSTGEGDNGARISSGAPEGAVGSGTPSASYPGQHFSLLRMRGCLAASPVTLEPAKLLFSLLTHLQMLAHWRPRRQLLLFCCSWKLQSGFLLWRHGSINDRKAWPGRVVEEAFPEGNWTKIPVAVGRTCVWHPPVPPCTLLGDLVPVLPWA